MRREQLLGLTVPILATSLAGLFIDAPAVATDFPLRVSPNGRYLEDSSGTPFYFVADTHWPLFWHYSLEEAREIIDDRAAKGFTAILVQVASAAGNRPNPYGHAPFEDVANLEVVLDLVLSVGTS